MHTTLIEGIARLEKLADFVEKIPEHRFNFATFVGADWGGKSDLSCGTTACALGWAATMPLFQKLGLDLDQRLWGGRGAVICQIDGETFHTQMGAEEEQAIAAYLFGIDRFIYRQLFIPLQDQEEIYRGAEYINEAEARFLSSDASPREWAAHAREIIEELKESVRVSGLPL